MKIYFYDNKVEVVNQVKKFIVYEIEAKNNIGIAERKAETIAKQLKGKLAGGWFTENAIPYNFKEDYKIVKVDFKTKISKNKVNMVDK